MQVEIQIDNGDWGESSPLDVKAVTESVVSTFPMMADCARRISITLRPTVQGYPLTLAKPNENGGFVVLLNDVHGRPWNKIAYQFAHEFCHVLADPRTWRPNRFAWFEESVCEAASFFALRAMARVWAVSPPFSNWQSYSGNLTRFADASMLKPEHRRPQDSNLIEWLTSKRPELEQEFSIFPPSPRLREYNSIVASELLPVFEADPWSWRAIRYLHFPIPPDGLGVVDFMLRWRAACPPEDRQFVDCLTNVLAS